MADDLQGQQYMSMAPWLAYPRPACHIAALEWPGLIITLILLKISCLA